MHKRAWFRQSPVAPNEWEGFSDIETALIEEALEAKHDFAALDECTIDFKHQVARTSNDETYSIECRMVNSLIRQQNNYQQRFTIPEQPILRSFDLFSHQDDSLIWKWMLEHELKPVVSNNISDAKYAWILEQAAAGIVSEGQKLNCSKAAQWLANKLLNVRYSNVDQIHKCVVFVYTCESFLYKLLNEQLRALDVSKYQTLGPYAYLLWLSWNVPTFHQYKYDQTIYRGAILDESMIEQYQQVSGKGPCTWHGFTSASKRQSLAVSIIDSLMPETLKVFPHSKMIRSSRAISSFSSTTVHKTYEYG